MRYVTTIQVECRRKLGLAVASTAGLALLTSCTGAVFESKNSSAEPGLKYFLPKTLVNIEIVPLGYPGGTKVAELTPNEKIAAANGSVQVKTMLAGRTQTVLVGPDGGLAEPFVTGLHLRLDTATPQEQVADAQSGLVLQYQPNSVYEDRVCMGVNNKGLLQFVEAAVKDQTGDIVVSIAKAVGRLIGPGAFSVSQPAQRPLTDMIVKRQIDPLDPWDRQSVEGEIDAHFPMLKGKYRFAADDAEYFLPKHPIAKESTGALVNESTRCPPDQICYRAVGPLRLSLIGPNGSRSVAYPQVVNRAVTHRIDVTRAFLVEKVTLLKFDGGVLQDVKIQKPSETLAAAKLPLTVYDAIMTSALAAPGRFLGSITPGMKPGEYKDLIVQYKTNVATVNGLREDLAKLREGDLTAPSAQPNFTLQCTSS